jgi:hypothetical protein
MSKEPVRRSAQPLQAMRPAQEFRGWPGWQAPDSALGLLGPAPLVSLVLQMELGLRVPIAPA